MVNFVTVIPALADDVKKIIKKLGFEANIYKITSTSRVRYTIRLSKNINYFLKTVNLIKN
jgi:predicted double-glycine peptidase